MRAEADLHYMNLSSLLEDALAERGNAVAVIANPADGENAVIWAANGPFARILDRSVDSLTGSRLVELRPLIERPEDWQSLIAATRTLASLSLDLKLRVNGREVWLGFNLTFKIDAGSTIPGDGHGILIGRDITEARERTLRETESQRLLASVFLRVGAAVVIVSADGAILMANPAFQHLLGYGAMELVGVNVETLTPPEYAEAARTARARQLHDGGGYFMRMDTFTKSGGRVPVTLHSAQLRDAHDRRLRVVTLIPDPPPPGHPAATAQPDPPEIGEVHAISLAALKTVYGKTWPLIASRAMTLAEQIIKRRLGPVDVISRPNGHSFVIWFHGTDDPRNLAIVEGAAQEIRQRLLAEMSDGLPGEIHLVSIGAEAIPVGLLAQSETALAEESPIRWDDDWEPPPRQDGQSLLRDLGANAVADVRPVTGRDGVAKPIVMLDFAPDVRRRLYDLVPSLPHEADLGTGFDLIRLDLADRVLGARREELRVLLPISWPALGDAGCRLSFDNRLDRIPQRARSHLMLAVSGVPPLLSAARWSSTVDPVRRRIAEVGLLLTHRDGDLDALQDAITSEWPLTLLVIDRTEGPPVAFNDYLNLIAAARRREISVLVRTTAEDDILDWRKLGATMFVAAS
jgi:PAS domain S-box-containing protein